MHLKSSRIQDALILLLLLLLPLLWFGPQTLGGKTLLPAENLYTFEPWAGAAASFGAGVPQNPLVSDLVLENYQWKSLLRDALRDGQVPLWNSRLFAGIPFLAAGQHSALYPLSFVFYVLPLWLAYGVFTWLQLGVAAAGTYVLARVLGQRRPAAFLAAVAFSLSGFFISSVNFSMIIAAAAWLPWILTTIELVLRTVESGSEKGAVEEQAQHAAAPVRRRRGPTGPIPYVAVGALLFGIQALAGHVEITYYVLMVSAFYAAWRLGGAWLRLRSGGQPPRARWARTLQAAAWLALMAVLGMGLGGVQLVPMYELAAQNFRQGSANLQQVIDWAWPKKQIITFLLPDFFGNPTHHSYFDIWRRSWQPVTLNALGQPLKDITNGAIDWGIKNYVEGANYLGLLTLLLALVAAASAAQAAWARVRSNRVHASSPAALRQPARLSWVPLSGFVVLAILSLLFAFGTPLYAVLFYLAPGYNQLHSAFRWVFPYSLSMALLAGFGLDMLLRGDLSARVRRALRVAAALAMAAGLGCLAAVALSLVLPGPFVALGDRLLAVSDLARERGFADGAMAWSYEAAGLARFGALAALSGAVLLWGAGMGRATRTGGQGQGSLAGDRPKGMLWGMLWPVAAIGVLILDLWSFGHAFNPASDPRLLAYKPPVIGWLQGMVDDSQPWRFTTYRRAQREAAERQCGHVVRAGGHSRLRLDDPEPVCGLHAAHPEPGRAAVQPDCPLLWAGQRAVERCAGQRAAEPAGRALRDDDAGGGESGLPPGLPGGSSARDGRGASLREHQGSAPRVHCLTGASGRGSDGGAGCAAEGGPGPHRSVGGTERGCGAGAGRAAGAGGTDQRAGHARGDGRRQRQRSRLVGLHREFLPGLEGVYPAVRRAGRGRERDRAIRWRSR